MKDLLMTLTILFNKLDERMRLIITLSLMLFIFLAWLFLLFMPLSRTVTAHTQKINTAKKNIVTLKALYKDNELIIQSPTQTLEQQMRALEKKLLDSKKRVLEIKKIIGTPEDLRNALQAISKMPPSASLNQIQVENNKIKVDFSSNYFETIQYLQYLEKLPWYLSFDSLDYQVEEYPNAKVKLVINVLGMNV